MMSGRIGMIYERGIEKNSASRDVLYVLVFLRVESAFELA